MKKVLFILSGTVLLLTGALTFRTIRFVSRQIEVPPEKMIRLDTQSIVGRLARAIQYRTISGQDTPNSTGEEFQSFHRFLDESFPGVNPNPTLFRRGSGDDPYSRGQWDTALRATPQSPKGDDSCGQCLRATCTLRCPRLPVSPLSLIAHAA